MKSKLSFLLAAVLAAGGTAVHAQSEQAQQGAVAGIATTAMTAMTAGEVRKVDLAQGKVTLKHEAITNLDMPAMTMVFRTERADLLKDLQPGDKVRFHAENGSGGLVVTQIRKDS